MHLQPIYHIDFDINLLGDCDTIVAELCRRAGWDLKHDMIPEDLKVDVQSFRHKDHIFTVNKVGEEVKKEIKVEVKVEINVEEVKEVGKEEVDEEIEEEAKKEIKEEAEVEVKEEGQGLPLRTNGVVKTEDCKSEVD
jgi:23S rRNA G2445 N2-methylase RlmL